LTERYPKSATSGESFSINEYNKRSLGDQKASSSFILQAQQFGAGHHDVKGTPNMPHQSQSNAFEYRRKQQNPNGGVVGKPPRQVSLSPVYVDHTTDTFGSFGTRRTEDVSFNIQSSRRDRQSNGDRSLKNSNYPNSNRTDGALLSPSMAYPTKSSLVPPQN